MNDNYYSNHYFCKERIGMLIQLVLDIIIFMDLIFYTHTEKQLYNTDNALLLILTGIVFVFSLAINLSKYNSARKIAQQTLFLIIARVICIVFFIVFWKRHTLVSLIIEMLSLITSCITLSEATKNVLD